MKFAYAFIHTKSGRKFRNTVEIEDHHGRQEVLQLMFLALLARWNRTGMGAWVYYPESDITFIPSHTFPGFSNETIQERLPL